jgi:anti-sigma B factor antagonist
MQAVNELEVYSAGELTVVGFRGRPVLDHLNLANCRDELVGLIREHHSKTLALDLTGVRLIPSGLLGLLASIRRQGVTVQLYNPSADIREVLEITKLNTLLELHDVEVPNLTEPSAAIAP